MEQVSSTKPLVQRKQLLRVIEKITRFLFTYLFWQSNRISHREYRVRYRACSQRSQKLYGRCQNACWWHLGSSISLSDTEIKIKQGNILQSNGKAKTISNKVFQRESMKEKNHCTTLIVYWSAITEELPNEIEWLRKMSGRWKKIFDKLYESKKNGRPGKSTGWL